AAADQHAPGDDGRQRRRRVDDRPANLRPGGLETTLPRRRAGQPRAPGGPVMSGDAERTETTTTTPEADAGLFQQFARSAGVAPKEDQLPATREFVGEFGQLLQGWLADQDRGGTVPHRPHAVLSALLREVDDRLSAQVNEVIHHEQFKKVEASWRGLNYLVRTTKPDPMIQFK